MSRNDKYLSKMRQKILHHIENELFCQIQRSSIHGVGVFAIRPIPKGIDPFKNLKNFRELKFKIDLLDKVHPSVVKQIKRFCFYNDEYFYLSTLGLNQVSFITYLNHSKSPNIKLIKNGGAISLKKIKQGEELTIDYDREFDDIHEFD